MSVINLTRTTDNKTRTVTVHHRTLYSYTLRGKQEELYHILRGAEARGGLWVGAGVVPVRRRHPHRLAGADGGARRR